MFLYNNHPQEKLQSLFRLSAYFVIVTIIIFEYMFFQWERTYVRTHDVCRNHVYWIKFVIDNLQTHARHSINQIITSTMKSCYGRRGALINSFWAGVLDILYKDSRELALVVVQLGRSSCVWTWGDPIVAGDQKFIVVTNVSRFCAVSQRENTLKKFSQECIPTVARLTPEIICLKTGGWLVSLDTCTVVVLVDYVLHPSHIKRIFMATSPNWI